MGDSVLAGDLQHDRLPDSGHAGLVPSARQGIEHLLRDVDRDGDASDALRGLRIESPGRNEHGEQVLLAESDAGSDLDLERAEHPDVRSDALAVPVDFRDGRDCIELED
jgi:hypothetical protein